MCKQDLVVAGEQQHMVAAASSFNFMELTALLLYLM